MARPTPTRPSAAGFNRAKAGNKLKAGDLAGNWRAFDDRVVPVSSAKLGTVFHIDIDPSEHNKNRKVSPCGDDTSASSSQ